MVQAVEVDILLYKGVGKTFSLDVFQVSGETQSPYSFGDNDVKLYYYPLGVTLPNPLPEVPATIVNNNISFALLLTTDEVGLYEYKVLEHQLDKDVLIAYGNIEIRLFENTTQSIDSFIAVEKPSILTIDENEKISRINYWRHYFQPHYSITDQNLHNTDSWPFLVNVLIAKLVIHDLFMKEVKNGLVSQLSSQSSSVTQGKLKRVETGPASVEFFEPKETTSSMFKSTSGVTPMDGLKTDICQLAQRLGLYLPMCGQVGKPYVPPVKSERELPLDPETLLLRL